MERESKCLVLAAVGNEDFGLRLIQQRRLIISHEPPPAFRSRVIHTLRNAASTTPPQEHPMRPSRRRRSRAARPRPAHGADNTDKLAQPLGSPPGPARSRVGPRPAQ